MRIGGLGILNRTNSRMRINVLSWHSPHSMTWRWIIALARHPLWTFKPYAFGHKNNDHWGGGLGLGQFAAVSVSSNNDGLQGSMSLLWHSLEFSQQRPMWYRDLYRRKRDYSEDRLGQVQAQREPNPDHPTIQ